MEFSEDGSGVPAQRKPCCAASRDNLGCLGKTPADEVEPNSYELHTVSGNVWERYSEESMETLKSEVAREVVRVLSGERPRSPVNEPIGRGPDG